MVIILIVIGTYSVQAQDTASTKIEGIEAEKVLVNGEIIFKHYYPSLYFKALIKYKKKLHYCYVWNADRVEYISLQCYTVRN